MCVCECVCVFVNVCVRGWILQEMLAGGKRESCVAEALPILIFVCATKAELLDFLNRFATERLHY